MHSLIRKSLMTFLGVTLLTASAAASERDGWPRGVTWSGSPLGGAHYQYGAAMAQVLNKELNVPMSLEATAGPWINMQLINDGDTDFAPSLAASSYEAYHGIGQAQGKPMKNLRVILPMYPQYFYWWTLNKYNIKSFEDLDGRIVCMAGRASFADDYGRKLFDVSNIHPSKIVNTTAFSDANSMMQDRQLEAIGTCSGVPNAATSEVTDTDDATILGVPDKFADAFIKQYPFVSRGKLPANSFRGQTEDIPTLTDWALVLANKDADEDFIYHVVKAVMENNPMMKAAFSPAKDCLVENAAIAKIPYHPGAIRYFEEKGIKLPEEAYADN